MKFTLSESFAIVAFFALTIGGLTSRPEVSWAATSLNFLFMVACAISALVAIGPQRAFAVGFLVLVILYWAVVLMISDHELSMRSGELPTSQLFQALLKPGYGSYGLSGYELNQRQRHAASLMPCGHSAVSVGLGYLAGKYGRYVYISSRRQET